MFLFLFYCFIYVSAQPAWINDVGAKTFPENKHVFKVNDFGAFKNQLIASTHALQKAIDSCSKMGGGRVEFEPGVYHTGAVFLKNNVNLVIGEGVELRALMGLEYYPEIETRVAGIVMNWPCGIINIIGQENVAVTGTGTIHAQGKIHWERYWNLRQEYTPKGLRWAADYDCKRVRTIEISNSKNVTLKSITIKQSGFWTVHLLFSKYITVDALTIKNNIDGQGPSTDGINVDSSELIEIMNCDVDGNDDNYCIKAGRDADGIRINKPSEFVYIHNCIARKGGGLIVIGSETSGWIRNVYVEKMTALGTSNVVYLKSAKTRGGGIQNIEIREIKALNVKKFFGTTLDWNPSYSYATLKSDTNNMPDHWKIMLQKVPEEKGIPHISNIKVSDCQIDSVSTLAFDIQGINQSIIESIQFHDIKINSKYAGNIEWANNISFKNVYLKTEDQKPLIINNSENIDTKGLSSY